MADPTRPTPRTDVPRPPGWCDWHGNVDPTSRVVIEINRSSGPPYDQSACETCRDRHKLRALNELPDTTTAQIRAASPWPQQREGQ